MVTWITFSHFHFALVLPQMFHFRSFGYILLLLFVFPSLWISILFFPHITFFNMSLSRNTQNNVLDSTYNSFIIFIQMMQNEQLFKNSPTLPLHKRNFLGLLRRTSILPCSELVRVTVENAARCKNGLKNHSLSPVQKTFLLR